MFASLTLSKIAPLQPRKHRGVVRRYVDDPQTFVPHRRRHRDRTVHGTLLRLRRSKQLLCGVLYGSKGRKDHKCRQNTDTKLGKVEAALILFKQSLERRSLHYTTILSYGDSRTYLALQEEKPYGFVGIDKVECVNHVQKHLGMALRNIISKSKDSGRLSGKGQLTADLIIRLSSYYDGR